jgi:hypothetical protein
VLSESFALAWALISSCIVARCNRVAQDVRCSCNIACPLDRNNAPTSLPSIPPAFSGRSLPERLQIPRLARKNFTISRWITQAIGLRDGFLRASAHLHFRSFILAPSCLPRLTELAMSILCSQMLFRYPPAERPILSSIRPQHFVDLARTPPCFSHHARF